MSSLGERGDGSFRSPQSKTGTVYKQIPVFVTPKVNYEL